MAPALGGCQTGLTSATLSSPELDGLLGGKDNVQGSLAGRVAIVTGAGQGMGRAFADRLAGAGAFVAIAEIDPVTGAQAAADIIAAGGRAHAWPLDVRDGAAIDAMVAELVAHE